ncbi:hypothetical protein [Neomegalonema sp.]|uniref:hypothetical protein n=1 Tax=Neomegalonema sp. TaxID=2039713 RepID=UPI002635F6B0|nr:hypothetical protein [Neomegalonema sp.]MDD2869631.1 hypothetical protein [Neomegalonema sp.]
MNLLEKAMSAKPERKTKIASQEEIDLALAWIQGKVTATQVNIAYTDSRTSTHYLYRMAIALRTAFNNGQIKIAK